MLPVPDQNDERAHEDAEQFLLVMQGIHPPQRGGQGHRLPFSGHGGTVCPDRKRYGAGTPETARRG